MSESLVIVESPAKAKTIKKYLGKNFKVEASMGHIRDLPKSKIAVNIENDFEPEYITIRGKGDLLSKLKKAAKKVDKIYLATDPDREGEAISWHLAHLLNVSKDAPCRITFNEITKNAVKKAIEHPTQINMNLVDAQQARRILDRIVGYKISPILWKKVKKGLSAGRVQSVATKLICDREDEINAFVEQEYWSLLAQLITKDKMQFEAKFYGTEKEKIELLKEEDVKKLISAIGDAEFVVQKVKKSEKRKSPAPPFITSSLQQEAHRKLGFATKKTMMIAQQLYEGVEVKGQGSLGLVTYIRTDSTRISDEAMHGVREFIKDKYGTQYLNPEVRAFKNKSASQDAHEAIRPSYLHMEPDDLSHSLTKDQYKLYKMIWSRFVASQMSSAVYDTVSVDLKAKEYLFKANGSKMKFQGFLTAYTLEQETSMDGGVDDETMPIPDLSPQEKVLLRKLNPRQHFTQPPPRYNEASLVKALEENGIGRPSTYAPTINTVLLRGYIEKKQKMLHPTELGIIVNGIMREHFKDIVDVDFTAQMEKDLDGVEEGMKKWVEILKNFYMDFEQVLQNAEENIGKIELKDQEAGIICNKCGRMMVFKLGRKGKKFIACPGFPECRNAIPIMEHAHALCPKCSGDLFFKDSKKGRKFLGCGNYPSCDFVSWDKPAHKDCPACGKLLLEKTKGRNTVEYCGNEACGYGKEEMGSQDVGQTKGEATRGANSVKSKGKAMDASKKKPIKKTATKKNTTTKKNTATKKNTESKTVSKKKAL
jgi:DNA topoisomerase I